MNDATDAARLISQLRDDIAALEQEQRQDAVVALLRAIEVADADSVTVEIEARAASNLTCLADDGDARDPDGNEELAFTEINDSVNPSA